MLEAEKRTILLVEDQAVIALSEKRALEKYGYSVVTAPSGEAAIDLLEHNCAIDLILMDINLGDGIDGTEASRRILERHNLPIVFLSSHSEPEIVEKTEKITSYGYILKNSSITVLDASIKMAFKLSEANSKLMERESSLAHAEMIANIGNWKLDLKTRTLEASEGARRIYGIESSISWDVAKEIPLPEYRRMLDQANRELITQGRRIDVEFRIRRANDGKTLWVRNISDYDKKKNMVIGVIEDITSRKLHEEELGRQENLLSSIIESSSESIFAKDLGGRYQLINRTGAKVIGFPQSEILGRTDIDLSPSEMTQSFARDDALVIEGGTTIEREAVFSLDGEEQIFLAHKSPWIDKDGATIGVIGISNNISQLKRLEIETKQFRNRLALAMTSAKLAWWELDTRTWRIYFDERIVGMFGYPPDMFQTAQDFFSLVQPDDQKAIRRAMPLLSSGQIAKYGTECRVMAVGGEYRWYRIIACAIKEGTREAPYNLTGVLMDIDEEKKADNKILSLLGEKDLILKEVHHRMKNNLSTIQSLLLLQAETLDESGAVKALEDASNRVGSMMVLYDRLYRSNALAAVSMKDYLPALTGMIVENFPNKDLVETRMDVMDFELEPRHIQPLGIIINEVITNIMKYAFVGARKGTITLTAFEEEGRVHLGIQDDGVGMPEDTDFKSTKGFGLMLIEMLTQQLNGAIRIERGNGTKVSLEFAKS